MSENELFKNKIICITHILNINMLRITTKSAYTTYDGICSTIKSVIFIPMQDIQTVCSESSQPSAELNKNFRDSVSRDAAYVRLKLNMKKGDNLTYALLYKYIHVYPLEHIPDFDKTSEIVELLALELNILIYEIKGIQNE